MTKLKDVFLLELVKNNLPSNLLSLRESKLSDSEIKNQLVKYKDLIQEKENQIADLFEFMTVLNQQSDRITRHVNEVGELLKLCSAGSTKVIDNKYKSILDRFVQNEELKQKIMKDMDITEEEKVKLLSTQRKLEEDLQKIQSRLNNLLKEKKVIGDKKEQLRTDYENLSKNIKIVEKDISDLNKDLDETKKNMSGVSSKLSKGEQAKSLAIKTIQLSQDIITLFNMEQDVQTKINPLLKEQQQLNVLKNEYSNLVQKTNQDMKNYTKIKQEIEEITKKIAIEKQKESQLTSELSSFNKTGSMEELKQLEATVKELTEKKNILSKDITSQKRDLQMKDSDIKNLNAEIVKLGKELENMKKAGLVKDNDIENLKKNLDKKKLEILELHNKLEQGRTYTLPEQLQKEINAIVEMADKMKMQVAFQNKLNEIIKKYEAKVEEIENRNKQMKAEIDKRKSQEAITQNIIKTLNLENQKISKSLNDAQKLIEEYKIACKEAQTVKQVSSQVQQLSNQQLEQTQQDLNDLKNCQNRLSVLVSNFKSNPDNEQLKIIMTAVAYSDTTPNPWNFWLVQDYPTMYKNTCELVNNVYRELNPEQVKKELDKKRAASGMTRRAD